MKRIVVGMDESEAAAEALRWAVSERRFRDRPIVAVMAWTNVDQHHVVAGAGYDPDYNDVRARAALDAYVESAVGKPDATTIDREPVLESSAKALIDASEGAELLVLGARSLKGVQRLLVSSVSQQCLHHMVCPTAVIRHGQEPSGGDGRIVVGVDGSADSARALDWALDEARARREPLDVVHSWVTPYLYGYPYAPPVDPAPYEHGAGALIQSMLDAADTDGLVAPPRPVLIDGQSTAGAILRAAEDASLLVVGVAWHRWLPRNAPGLGEPADHPPRRMPGGRSTPSPGLIPAQLERSLHFCSLLVISVLFNASVDEANQPVRSFVEADIVADREDGGSVRDQFGKQVEHE